MTDARKLPLIFDVHPGSLDDGPGIRTVVFFKGCPLACIWCHNPESQSPLPEMAFYPDRCIGCGECGRVCPNHALDPESPEMILRDQCSLCGQCAQECYALALRKVGEEYPVARLVELLRKDEIFYKSSGGGVTFSGGEPLLYMDYLSEVMRLLKAEGVHLTIETCGYFDQEEFATKILPYTDLLLFDLKLFDPVLHRQYTGQDNQCILANFRYVVSEPGLQVIPRIPEIPGITDTPENLQQITDFLKENNCREYHLLPFNPGGLNKRIRLGKEIPPAMEKFR